MKPNNNLKLVYVKQIGKDTDGLFEYEFFFSEKPENTWAENWNEPCPSACGDLTPDGETYSDIFNLKTTILFDCAQNNSCYSLMDMQDNVICCASENISDYDEYPEPIRLVFEYGASIRDVREKLALRHQFFRDDIFDDEDDDTDEDKKEEE